MWIGTWEHDLMWRMIQEKVAVEIIACFACLGIFCDRLE